MTASDDYTPFVRRGRSPKAERPGRPERRQGAAARPPGVAATVDGGPQVSAWVLWPGVRRVSYFV